MSSSHELVRELNIDEKLVIDFFIIFSRFEYALKRGGYANGGENKVEANWEQFAATLRDTFQPDRTEDLRQAVAYLQDNPPRKQIWKDNDLDWKEDRRDTEPLPLRLINFTRTIRNNLFHGGKFPLGPVHDVGRDTTLLKSSLIILNECLELSPGNVHFHFFRSGRLD